jgi:hypothetical protein
MFYMNNPTSISSKLISTVYPWCEQSMQERPVATSLVMLPGIVLLETAYCVALLVDTAKDAAMAALNLLGIIVTLNEEKRSSFFKQKLIQYSKNLLEDLKTVIIAPIIIPFLTLWYQSQLITALYFKVLDNTFVANFYSKA